ncbi:unnamed protein product [Peronospora destructor]|uniref:Uncharacterized protein n=1 Tax=Peronospora destructor TaxID=86335 RepID=A0AAV0TR79_9STRA|nr:unnamed protein product [Peronospora destructor]
MIQAKAEKTIHEALQSPSDQDANVITIGQWFSLMIREPYWSRSSHVGLRSSVATARERFGIPGSIREDRTAAWQETARAIRQMRRHLKMTMQTKFVGSSSLLDTYATTQPRCRDRVPPIALHGL